MRTRHLLTKSSIYKNKLFRYVLNGLIATLIHYAVLNFNIYVLDFSSMGAANTIAACIGILASFIGSRYFVFRANSGDVTSQLTRFVILYSCVALLSGAILYIWSDVYGLTHHLGFLIATCAQVAISYSGNKLLVFKHEV